MIAFARMLLICAALNSSPQVLTNSRPVVRCLVWQPLATPALFLTAVLPFAKFFSEYEELKSGAIY